MCLNHDRGATPQGPVAEHEARTLLQELNAHAGAQLELVGMAELGAIDGAAFVRWPDGRGGVLTRVRRPVEQLERTAEILNLARARGVPVPRYELITEVAGYTVIVQERLPGEPTPTHIELPMMEAILGLVDSFAGVLRDRLDLPNIDLHLERRRGEDGVSQFDSLAGYDDRSRRLLAWIREVDAASPDEMTGDDLINTDFSRDNILFDTTGNVTGIVDWHGHPGPRRGDRRWCLLSLRFDLAWALLRTPRWNTIDPDALRMLEEAIDSAIDPDTFRLYWAHHSLNIVAMMIGETRCDPKWRHELDPILDFTTTDRILTTGRILAAD